MRSNLIFGSVWLGFFILFTLLDDMRFRWMDYGYLLVAALYLGTYFYQKRYGYLTLEDGVLKLNDPRKKHINLNQVRRFKYFAGDFILESETKKLKINTHLLEPPSVVQLKVELEKYGLKPGTNRKVQMESN
ncbi:MAG: hypothetical protein R3356_05910 [Eudoraea sp.]|nr:hypothetical protein [Eudoraea sp.]